MDKIQMDVTPTEEIIILARRGNDLRLDQLKHLVGIKLEFVKDFCSGFYIPVIDRDGIIVNFISTDDQFVIFNWSATLSARYNTDIGAYEVKENVPRTINT